MTNDELLNLIVEGIQERKGKNITHVDLTGLEYVSTEHFSFAKAHPRCRFLPSPTLCANMFRRNQELSPSTMTATAIRNGLL